MRVSRTACQTVSCIMPTRNRRAFVSQAIWYFLCQDYPNRELIVVDDGSDGIRDLIPDDRRLRYIRLSQPVDLLSKRQIAIDHSCGDYIAHWDDDDWHAPNRLTEQMRALQSSQATCCVIRSVLHYDVFEGQAWINRRSTRSHTGTWLYDKRYAARLLHDETGNDSPPHIIDSDSLYIAVIHQQNQQTPKPTHRHWLRQPIERIFQIIDTEQDFYASLRDQGRKPRSTLGDDPAVNLVAPFLVYDGYGSVAEYLALSMSEAGARVNPEPLTIDVRGLSDDFRGMLKRWRGRRDDPTLFFCWINGDFDRYAQFPNLFVNTMWESSQPPAGWVEKINRARAVIVPTWFVARMFKRNGVTQPIYVIPEGVDPQVYPYIERPPREGVTALMVSTLIERKHWREAVAAWQLAFEGDSTARLLIKSHWGHHNDVPADPRIHFVDDNEPTRGIADWYARADVLLALGSEGFGLPLVEGMATGLPVVALNAEGQSDVCDGAPDCVLPVRPARYVPYDDKRFGRCGEFAVPDVEQAAAHLRWVAANRDDARVMGKRASQWAHTQRNIWDKGPAVLDVLERHTTPPRTLRHLPTVVVPSWKTRCGVAAYTRDLTRELSAVRVVSSYDPACPAPVVHIQHQHSLFDQTQLLKLVQRTKRLNRSVIITEHAVLPTIEPWEQHADALIALSGAGAKRLQARWRNKAVYHVPHGMHTWFPPRKRHRGRVIGLFGFLEAHKGFWQVLDVLKRNPDLSVRMYSTAKSRHLLERWQQDAAGLPIEHVTTYLPEEQIAANLAAETDILVYWYDDLPFDAVSGAARTGLATGVPVLTSPTRMFADLQGVTYQPQDLETGIQTLLDDTQLREQVTAAARDYCHSNSWQTISQKHQTIWNNHRS